MREGYCVEVEQDAAGRWSADVESYRTDADDLPLHSFVCYGDTPSEALRNVATAIYDLRHEFHD